jgi:hypothetical protein
MVFVWPVYGGSWWRKPWRQRWAPKIIHL